MTQLYRQKHRRKFDHVGREWEQKAIPLLRWKNQNVSILCSPTERIRNGDNDDTKHFTPIQFNTGTTFKNPPKHKCVSKLILQSGFNKGSTTLYWHNNNKVKAECHTSFRATQNEKIKESQFIIMYFLFDRGTKSEFLYHPKIRKQYIPNKYISVKSTGCNALFPNTPGERAEEPHRVLNHQSLTIPLLKKRW